MLRQRAGLDAAAPPADSQLDLASARDWFVLRAGSQPPETAARTAQRRATNYVASLARPRVWTSADGRYTCVASVVRIDPEAIVLRRADSGNLITVPLARLSALDRDVVLR
jgi:hypothetical protein